MENKEKNFISAVIYVHNCGSEVGVFLEMVQKILAKHFECSEIICVNDSSTDDSAARVKETAKRFGQVAGAPPVSVLNMSYFHGLELAMNAGVDLAIGDFVLEFDRVSSDFGEEEILAVYRKCLEGYDIVSACPEGKQRMSSTLYYSVLAKFTNWPGKLHTERFRILSRRVINRVSSMNTAVPYRKALYAGCGLKTYCLCYQPAGNPKSIGKDPEEDRYRRGLAIDTLILFTDVGYRFSVAMTALMMLAAGFMAIYSVVVYLTNVPVAGWTTTVLFLSFAFFGLFGVLTVVIKYLQILVDLVFKRKRYSFEGIEKL